MTTGSFYNNLYGNMVEGRPEPEIGMGATRLCWTDRIACTIIGVLKYDKDGRATMIEIQEDKAIRTDDLGMSDSQDYRYEQNLEGSIARYTLRKNGRWVQVGGSHQTGERLLIGVRKHYHDYSF